MRKNIISIAVIAAAIMAASCQKEINPESGTPIQDAPQFTASIESCGNTKTTVERVDVTPVKYKTKWENTDLIKINSATFQATPDGTDKTKATFTMTEGTAPSADYHAYFPASIYDGSNATLPATYTYEEGGYNMPMYAESSTTSLSFKNLCGILAITVPSTQMTKVKSITVTSNQRMNGNFTASADGVLTFTSSAVELSDADKKVTLTFTNSKTIESSVTFYIPVPAGTHNSLIINVSDNTLMKTMATKQSGGVKIERNVVYPITFADNQPLILPGLFSVSATKQVRFTKGNLWWNGSAFKLEENQTDYQTEWNTNHVSHFFWTKTAENSYTESYSDGTSTVSDVPFFAESKGGLTVDGQSGLFALSSAEWTYLLSSTSSGGRGDGDLKFKYPVTVNGVKNCLVIAPDGYTGTIAESYDAAAWATVEADGLVCLPAAGYRYTSNRLNSNNYYWSATPHGTESGSACLLNFKDSIVLPSESQVRHYASSVRLVCSVSN